MVRANNPDTGLSQGFRADAVSVRPRFGVRSV